MKTFKVLFALCSLCLVSCDPFGSAAIAFVPRPDASVDTTRDAAFALVSRVAQRRGLEQIPARNINSGLGWAYCLIRGSLILCGKVHAEEVQFLMYQRGYLTAASDSVRREILDSLRSQFGSSQVRECSWQNAPPGQSSGCPPPASADTAQH
jgi:hypothetical protein